jgi:poly(3-hydroxybutyrate) depolymerase
MRLRLVALAAIIACWCISAAAVHTETGFLDRTVSVEGKDYRYQVYVPAAFASQKSWPVILFLHGSGDAAPTAWFRLMSAFRMPSARTHPDSRSSWSFPSAVKRQRGARLI